MGGLVVSGVEPIVGDLHTTSLVIDWSSDMKPDPSHDSREVHQPISYGQRGLWVLDQSIGTSRAYNMSTAVRMKGHLDFSVFRMALSAVVAKHKSLRSSFVTVDGTPRQLFHEPETVDIRVVDIADLASDQQATRLAEEARSEADAPFVLAQPPLFRFKLVRIGLNDQVFFYTLHHIIYDASSHGVFSRDLSAFYSKFLAGDRSYSEDVIILKSRPSDDSQFIDAGDRRLAYWRKALRDVPERLILPSKPLSGFREMELERPAGTYRVTLDHGKMRTLKQFCRCQGVTQFMALLSALYILLARYTGQEDIVVGAHLSGRSHPALESSIGLSTNLVLCRQVFQETLTVREFLAKVRQTALEAVTNQLPLELLIERSIFRSTSRWAPCQVVFGLVKPPDLEFSLKGLTLEEIDINTLPSFARYELEVQALQKREALELSWRYDRFEFEDRIVAQMANGHIHLLETMIASGEERLTNLSVISTNGLSEVKVWEASHSAEPIRSAVEFFEAAASRQAESIAITCGERSLRYEDAASRVGMLAGRLMAVGVRRGEVVGVALPRSVDTALVPLALWKIGAVYLPLDAGMPPARLHAITTQTPLTCIVTTKQLAYQLPTVQKRVLLDDSEPQPGSAEHCDLTRMRLAPADAAYIIFTSGSSGQPKGVVVEHQSLSAFFKGILTTLPLGPDDRHVAVTSTTFDISIQELILPLCCGSSVVVAKEAEIENPRELLRLIEVSQATSIQATPTYWKSLLEDGASEHLAAVRLIAGGESLSKDLARRLCRAGREVWNLYGPTETTIWATAHKVGQADLDDEAPTSVSIGTPLPGYSVYVLDKNRRRVPPGIVGEIYIGGDGVARGYSQQSALTSERFVTVPGLTDGRATERLYRTGDMARWRDDGMLIFLGRSDRQVKLRGYRIELEEIETVLRRHEEVRDAAVTIRQEGENSRIAAYVLRQLPSADTVARTTWRRVWDAVYSPANAQSSSEFAGWISSYTGAPIPQVEMEESYQETVRHIKTLNPSDVLEIGCGSGLFAKLIAPECRSYLGIDFSSFAIDHARRSVPVNNRHVRFKQAQAHETSFLEDCSLDLVILNSVIQYFPDSQYLSGVLEEAVRVTRPGGHIFVGDIRDLRLLEAFHASVEIQRSGSRVSVRDLRRRITRAMNEELELLVAPRFFQGFSIRSPRVAHASVFPKTGRFKNELNQFRYNVILAIGDKQYLKPPSEWVSWDAAGEWERSARHLLFSRSDIAIGIENVPLMQSAGVLSVVQRMRVLPPEAGVQDVLNSAPMSVGDYPVKFHHLSESVHWVPKDEPHIYDVVLRPQYIAESTETTLNEHFAPEQFARTPTHSGKTPLDNADFVRRLQTFARTHLPHYMVPPKIAVLSAWPLTANGKLDYIALPDIKASAADAIATETLSPYAELICRVLTEVLELGEVSSRDNFFDLGGDSLSATRLISQLADMTGIRLSFRDVFNADTVDDLAALLQSRCDSNLRISRGTRSRGAL